MLKGLFPKKTIPSSFFGEYTYCWIILSHWIHILVIISCVKTFYVLQNQSFFQFVPLVYVIFSNRKLQIVGNYIHKMVIKFAFCVVSLLWTSRYVLICCLYSSYANVLEICLPITSIYPFTDGQLHHEYPVTASYSDFRECSQNSHGPPCGTIFMRFVTHFTHFYGLLHRGWWLF